MKIQNTIAEILAAATVMSAAANTISIDIEPKSGDATAAIREALAKASDVSCCDTVFINFSPGAVYHLSRQTATPVLYHISNTTSILENPDPTKHVGILIRGLRNVVFDGHGATLMTHGEMTPWVIDSCRNITIKNFTIDSADPSVPEMTVTSVDSLSFTATVNPSSNYDLRNGRIYWVGEGWEFTDGIAQLYDPATASTRRCASPVVRATMISELSPRILKFTFDRRPEARVGQTYQMRHSLRTEVAGFINHSQNITLENLKLRFMGNFGIVAQVSSDICYRNLNCAPDPQSGRTCAGFADFLQVSGCKGLIDISGCNFNGSQDDPINVHGTHLRITDWGDGRHLTVTYMHPQTYGFQSFFSGDSIEVVNPDTLLPVAEALIESAEMLDDYNIRLTLDRVLPAEAFSVADAVVENITYTPEVRISDCSFNATPTRGILISTRRPVVIENNVFFRTPMAAILVADDARSWFESGPVKDLTIRDNLFIDCSLPVIQITPEIREYQGDVHTNILISGNKFEFSTAPTGEIFSIKASSAKCVDNEVKTYVDSDSSKTR